MKTIKYTFTLISLFCSIALLGQGVEKEHLTVALSNPGKPYKLVVGLLSGSIRVTGHSADNLIINVEVEEDKKPKKSDQKASGLKRIGASSGYEINAVEKNNEVTINNHSMMRKIDLDIKVPLNGTLVLNTLNEGDIVVSNIKGELELNNVNGDIKVSGFSGTAVANTVNGDISVAFAAVTEGKPMAFSTFNGDVNLNFPATTKANLKMKTDQGEIFSDFEVAIDKSSAAPVKTNSGGTYKISKDAWVTGKINGGGAELMVKSWSGDLYIRKNK